MNTLAYKNHHSLLVAVDCIIFGFDGKDLKALLVKRSLEPEMGKWSLMGGFVSRNESVEDAAVRVLDNLTGLTNIYMEQLHCFGNIDRDYAARVISIAYFALIKIDDYGEALMKEHHAKWVALNKIPPLVFDHKKMIQLSQEYLQQKAINHPIGFELLPNKFTLQQLQALYEAVYVTTFDKRNFTKKILSLNLLQKLPEKEKSSSKKGAFLYTFNKGKYNQLKKQGMRFL
ncbi:MAG: NUDIX hydrolase [Chitinophagaceae bacterium]|nr:NUDIX hydrolase [Chitinophagaceae bacterium]